MFLKIICWVLFMNSIGLIDAVFQCDRLSFAHGRIRYSNRGRRARFSCIKPYSLIGNPRIDCEHGVWNGPAPVCASRNCGILSNFYHGKVIYFNSRAIAKLECNAGFTLNGSSNLVCEESFDGQQAVQWNFTNMPECQANTIRQFNTCDYEAGDEKHCQWISRSGLFNWTVMSSNRKDSAYMPVSTFPDHDHTIGENLTGHFLYLETLYAPTKVWLSLMNTKQAPGKYISPLFPPTGDEAHCLIFYLYANGSHPGIVDVLIGNESIWKSNGSLGSEWNRIKIPLHNRTTNFRITIEGKGELEHPYTRTAIDDLRIAIGEECLDFHPTEEEAQVTQTSTHAAETTTTMLTTTTMMTTMTTTMISTTDNPTIATLMIQSLDMLQTTEQPDQFGFTTLPPESQVLNTETTSPPEPTSLNHIHYAGNKSTAANNHVETPTSNSSHLDFVANSIPTTLTNHNGIMFNMINYNNGSEEFNTEFSFTTQPPKSQDVNNGTKSPQWSLLHHIRYVANKLKKEADRTTSTMSPWNSISRFNFSANSLTAPTNHNTTLKLNTINNNDVSEEFNTSSENKYTQSPINGEIIITENNLIYSDNSSENKTNDIIVEQDVPLNATFGKENDNELHIKPSTTNESLTDQRKRDEKEKETLSNDLSMLKNYLPKGFKEVTDTPVTSTTHLKSISNNTVVELNNTKYKHEHEEENSEEKVEETSKNPRHSGNGRKIRLQTSNNENKEMEKSSSIKTSSYYVNQSSSSMEDKLIWVISLVIICIVVMFFVVQGYKKYYFRKRRKDETSIRFVKKDDGNAESPHKKDDILMLDCVPKKMA